MDRKTIFAFLLIALVIIFYPVYMQKLTGNKKSPVQKPAETQKETPITPTQAPLPAPELLKEKPTAVISAPDTLGPEKIIAVETPLYSAKFSSRGGSLVYFHLNKYKDYKDRFVRLTGEGEIDTLKYLSIIFPDSGFSLKKFNFSSSSPDKIILEKKDQTESLIFSKKLKAGLEITKEYTFYADKYSFDFNLKVSGNRNQFLGRKLYLDWPHGLSVTEKDKNGDLGYFAAYGYLGGELLEEKKFNDDLSLSLSKSGKIKWTATRSKYFLAALVPQDTNLASGFQVQGRELKDPQGTTVQKNIGVYLESQIPQSDSFSQKFTIFLGPINYFILKKYKVGLENVVNLGWKIIRPFSILILWYFVNMFKVIPNYGLVIIIFSVLMKVIFYPLSVRATKSAMKMQELQPKIAKLKERYKDDKQRFNVETMKLYKEYKINPLGGCLPLVIQMPLFYALYVVFTTSIELRGAKFIGYLSDLSQADPYYILPIVMAVTMFFQMKFSMKDPKQKMLVYVFPIFFFFLFKSFPAGLVLYWTMYNLLSIIEQTYVKSKLQPAPVEG